MFVIPMIPDEILSLFKGKCLLTDAVIFLILLGETSKGDHAERIDTSWHLNRLFMRAMEPTATIKGMPNILITRVCTD